ncbi:MAG TPA: (d)CMP kinase [Myxococcaceae bacterium]|nr:(d)CMP kinase [Myxococcaceae bacterium]
MSRRPFIVAIDGPAGAGKSTVSRILARRLGFALVDTGAIYRCVALQAAREGIPLDDDLRLGRLLERIHIGFRMVEGENHAILEGKDVSAEIRTPEVSMGASAVSSRPVVRQGLLDLQRRLALEAPAGAILEGRDIGTVVFPDADAKFFLEASPDVRARRRYEELFQRGTESTLETVLGEQTKRDHDDATRAVAPLRPAEDATRVDSTALPLSEVVQGLEAVIRARLARRAS